MVAFTTTGLDPFHQNLRAALEADIKELKENLCNNLARDIEQYRYMCGTIVALQQVLERCEEIETKMYGQREDEGAAA